MWDAKQERSGLYVSQAAVKTAHKNMCRLLKTSHRIQTFKDDINLKH